MRAARSLAFPPYKSAGTLFGVGPDGRRRRLAPALGDVARPEGMRFGATITEPEALGAFDALRPRDLEWIDLHKSPGLDHHLAPLGRLAGLREVNLSKASLVGDEGLAHLRHVWALRDLDLYRTGVGDHGLLHLRRLHSLERLHLGMTQGPGPRSRPPPDAPVPPLVEPRGYRSRRRRRGPSRATFRACGKSCCAARGRRPRVWPSLRRANPHCRVHGDLEHNEWRIRYEELRRELLTILVRRADPRAPVHRESPATDRLRRAQPARFHPERSWPRFPSRRRKGGPRPPGVTSSGWDQDLVSARRLNAWLLGLPEGCSIRVTPPDAAAYQFPWITRSPTHRAGRC